MKNRTALRCAVALCICIFAVTASMSQTYSPLYGTRLELKNGSNKTTIYPPSSGGLQYLYLPTDSPSDGDALVWNTGGYLSWDAISGGSGATIQFARKTTDESYTSANTTADTTMQNDDDLKLTFAANEVWEISGMIIDTCSHGGPDMRFTFDAPTGTSVALSYYAFQNNNNFTLNGNGQGIMQNVGARRAQDIPGDKSNTMFVRGLVVMGGTGGDLQFQWKMDNINPVGRIITVRTNSYLKATIIQ